MDWHHQKNRWIAQEDTAASWTARQKSQVVWWDKGVLEVWMMMSEPRRYESRASIKSVAEALKEYFGVQGRVICDVGYGTLKKDKIATRVAFYGCLQERPSMEKVNGVREVIRQALVELEYIATVKATGETEYVSESELPYSQIVKSQIYLDCINGGGHTIKGRRWKIRN